MLRTLLLLVALVIIIGIVLVSTNIVNLRPAPDGGVAVETRDLEVNTAPRNVKLPVIKLEERQVQLPQVTAEGNSVANAQ